MSSSVDILLFKKIPVKDIAELQCHCIQFQLYSTFDKFILYETYFAIIVFVVFTLCVGAEHTL